MVLPVTDPYPSALGLVVARAAAALPAAGAWDPTPTEFNVADFNFLTLYLAYTRAAAGGAFDIMLEGSPFSADSLVYPNWYQTSIYVAGALAAGVDTQSRFQREFLTYQATGAAQEAFIYGPVDLDASVERMRITARESGAVGNPGTLLILAYLNK